MPFVRPDAIRHAIAVLRSNKLRGEPAIRDDIKLTVLAGEHQHQGTHVARRTEIQTGIARAPLQVGGTSRAPSRIGIFRRGVEREMK